MRRAGTTAFLLAQVGAHAASKFADRLAEVKLTPAHAGVLRILGSSPGVTQHRLAMTLGMVPSRLVTLIDELEARGMVERRENPEDRRRYALHLTQKGRAALADIGRISREHSEALCAALSRTEQEELAILLQRIAEKEGLAQGVHPGYKHMGAAGRTPE